MVNVEGKELIFKPRNCYFEYLLLSNSSPLRKKLSKTKLHSLFSDAFGNLNYEFKDDNFFEAITEPVISQELDSDTFIKSFGRLIAVTGVLGITDLHNENLKYANNRIQLLDIESIFWNSEIISDSMLLHHSPSKMPFTLYAATHNHLKCIGLENGILILIISILTSMKSIKANVDSLLAALSAQSNEMAKFPIRILLRETREYKQALLDQSLNDFIEWEKNQLSQGNIPYFFGYLGDSNVYSQDLKGHVFKVDDVERFNSKVSKAFKLPSFLLDLSRLERLTKQLILSTLKILLKDLAFFEHSNPKLKVKKYEGMLVVEYDRERIGCAT